MPEVCVSLPDFRLVRLSCVALLGLVVVCVPSVLAPVSRAEG